jgi:hypothetical protein
MIASSLRISTSSDDRSHSPYTSPRSEGKGNSGNEIEKKVTFASATILTGSPRKEYPPGMKVVLNPLVYERHRFKINNPYTNKPDENKPKENKLLPLTSKTVEAVKSIPSNAYPPGAKVVLNPLHPLHGSKGMALKEFRNESIGLLKFPQIVSDADFKKIAEKFATNHVTDLAVPSKENLLYTFMCMLSRFLERKPKVKENSSDKLMEQLIMGGAFTHCFFERAKEIHGSLKLFIRSNKRSTKSLDCMVNLLEQLFKWKISEDVSQIKHRYNPLIMLFGFSWGKEPLEETDKEFLIRLFFEKKEWYLEFNEWIGIFLTKTKQLDALIRFTNYHGGISLPQLDNSILFPVSMPSGLLKDILTTGIVRSFFPGEKPNIDKISVNGKPFEFQSPEGSVKEIKTAYFKSLLSACFNDHWAAGSLNRLVDQEVENLLTCGDNSFKSLRLLSAGTVESWNRADKLIRFLFPGLNTRPFLFKVIQGIELEISIKSFEEFFVIQRKTYNICLRRSPLDSKCTQKQREDICSIVFEWKVSSKKIDSHYDERGDLRIANICFAKHITPYEQKEILLTLSKPKSLPLEWYTLPFPSFEREFPTFEP